jgi:hypothetical protein
MAPKWAKNGQKHVLMTFYDFFDIFEFFFWFLTQKWPQMTIPLVSLAPLGPKGPKIAIFAILVRARRDLNRAREPHSRSASMFQVWSSNSMLVRTCVQVWEGGGLPTLCQAEQFTLDVSLR